MRPGRVTAIHFGSTFLASTVGFVATLYIAQELGSATLGAYSLFIAVVIWLRTGFAEGINYAVSKRLSETGTGGRDLGAGLTIQVIVFILVSIALYAVRGLLNSYLSFRGTKLMIFAFAVVIGFSLIVSILHGEKKVHFAAILKPVDRIVRSGIHLGVVFLAILGGGVTGLVWGYVVGAVVALTLGIAMISITPRIPRNEHFRNISRFGQYSWLSGIEQRSFSAMDTLVLGAFVSTSLVAYYEVAWNLASLLAIFGTSISQTLFPEISDLDSRNDTDAVAELITDGVAYLGLFLIPGLFGVVIIGEQVLAIYGTEFRQATTVLILLVTARLVYVYQAQFVSALNALDYPGVAFRVNLVFVALNLLLNISLVCVFGWVGAAVATGLAATAGLVISFRALRSVILFEIPIREIGSQVLAGLIMGLIVMRTESAIPELGAESLITAFLLVGVGSVTYASTLLLISTRFRSTLVRNLRQ